MRGGQLVVWGSARGKCLATGGSERTVGGHPPPTAGGGAGGVQGHGEGRSNHHASLLFSSFSSLQRSNEQRLNNHGIIVIIRIWSKVSVINNTPSHEQYPSMVELSGRITTGSRMGTAQSCPPTNTNEHVRMAHCTGGSSGRLEHLLSHHRFTQLE